jgi:uncharacterized protein
MGSMVIVKVKRGYNKRPLSVEIKGHALFDTCGSDIVCAAVSILAQTVIFAWEDLLNVKPAVKMEKGYLYISSPSDIEEGEKERFDLLMETMLLGLKETARSYPSYIVYKER